MAREMQRKASRGNHGRRRRLVPPTTAWLRLRRIWKVASLKKKNKERRVRFWHAFMPSYYVNVWRFMKMTHRIRVVKVRGGFDILTNVPQPEPDKTFEGIVSWKQLDDIIVPKGKVYRVTGSLGITYRARRKIFIAAIGRNIQYRDQQRPW